MQPRMLCCFLLLALQQKIMCSLEDCSSAVIDACSSIRDGPWDTQAQVQLNELTGGDLALMFLLIA